MRKEASLAGPLSCGTVLSEVVVGKLRYALLIIALVMGPVIVGAALTLALGVLWLFVAMYLFGAQWELLMLALVSAAVVGVLMRVAFALLKAARAHLVREHVLLTAGACALISVGFATFFRAGFVNHFTAAGALLYPLWALGIIFAVRVRR